MGGWIVARQATDLFVGTETGLHTSPLLDTDAVHRREPPEVPPADPPRLSARAPHVAKTF